MLLVHLCSWGVPPTVLMSHKDDVTVWDDLTVQDVTEETGRQPHTAERKTGEVAVSQTRLLDVSSFMWAVEELSPFYSLHVPLISHLSPSHLLPSFPPHTSFPLVGKPYFFYGTKDALS